MTGPVTVAAPGARGQTSIDFLVGVSVFLLAVGFAVGTVPSIVDPFTAGQESPLVADRVTSQLVEGMMSDGTHPNALNETCTYAFFDDSYGSGSGCPIAYDATENDLADRLGIDSTYRVNVTIKRNVSGDASLDTICTDGTMIGECGGGLPTRLAIGNKPPTTQTITATRRMAYLDGKEVVVVVKLW